MHWRRSPSFSLCVDASKCLEGFAEASSLPVDNSTDNAALYKVLPSGVHLFPQVKFLCDGSVQSLEIRLFYTAAVHDRWERILRAELLLLSSDGTYRECSSQSLNCLKMEHNLTDLASKNTSITHLLNPCGDECMRFRKNVILTLSIKFDSIKTVKRGDYLGLVVPPRERSFEDALPVMYTGSEYKTPLVALPPGSFVPSGEFNCSVINAMSILCQLGQTANSCIIFGPHTITLYYIIFNSLIYYLLNISMIYCNLHCMSQSDVCINASDVTSN